MITTFSSYDNPIKITDMPSYPDYEKFELSYHGKGFLGHFWASIIRPRLNPKEHELFRAAFKLAESKVTQEFLDACYKQFHTEAEQ